MFAHPVMLAGVCGAVIPLLIHMLNRARRRTVRWGAMMFLSDDHGSRDSLARLASMIPLMLRMAIVAALAAVLARPFSGDTSNSNSSVSDRRLCVVILFDNSAGMAFDEGSAGKRIDIARRATLAVVTGLQRDDEVHFVPLAAPGLSAEAPSDLQSAVAAIADLQPGDHVADIAAGLKAAKRIFDESAVPRKVVLLVASRQAACWRNVSDVFAATLREQLLKFGDDLRMIFLPVGGEGSANVAIDRIDVSPTPAVRGIPEPIRLSFHNYGKSDISELPIELRVVGQRSDQRFSIDVPAGQRYEIVRSVLFPSKGSHILTARIRDPARVPGMVTFDDQSEAVLETTEPLKVLVLENDLPSTLPATSAAERTPRTQSDIVSAALTPIRSGGGPGSDPFQLTSEIDDAGWIEHVDRFSVVIVSGTHRLDERAKAALEKFVNSGGGVIVLPSASSTFPSTAASTASTSQAASSPLFSFEFQSRKSVADGRIRLTSLGGRYLFPAPSIEAAIQKVRLPEIVPQFAEEVVPTASEQVLLQTIDRQPLIVVKFKGVGRVAVCGIPMSEDDAITHSPAVVLLMQSLARFVGNANAPHCNLESGETMTFSSSEPLATRALVTLPDGTRQNGSIANSADRSIVSFTNTRQPGRYALMMRGQGVEKIVPFIVRADRDASDLTPIADQTVDRLTSLLGMRKMSANEPAAVTASMKRPQSNDFWPMSIISLVAGLLIELWVSDRRSGVGLGSMQSAAKVT